MVAYRLNTRPEGVDKAGNPVVFHGYAHAYKLSEPYKERNFIIISCVERGATGEPEMVIYPATPKGKVWDWKPIHFFRGGITRHEEILEAMGYSVSSLVLP